MALPFMKAESEENATQAIAFIGMCVITLALVLMNVTGAIAHSEPETALEYVVVVGLAMALSGAEILAAVILVRVMLAPNLHRKIVGTIIFVALAWACVQNGKRAIHMIFPEFEESATLLRARAQIEQDNIETAAKARKDASEALPALLAGVQGKIGALESERRLMASQSPEKIAEAQAVLIASGKYFAEVDGIRGPETEKAMRARGEEIRVELESLKLQEANLLGLATAATATNTATDDASAAVRKAEFDEGARQAEAAGLWIEVMLWVLEGARSFGLWSLVTTITAENRTDRPAPVKAKEEDEDLSGGEPPEPAKDKKAVKRGNAAAQARRAANAQKVPIGETLSIYRRAAQ